MDPCNEGLISEERQARYDYQCAHTTRYKYLRLKAKAHWLKNGDMNTDYFHACIKKRRVQNRICSIVSADG